MTPPHLLPPLLLFGSNILMTFAWYGHLERPAWPLWVAVLASWGIALLEHCLAAPANRIGYASGAYTGRQLKVMQEVITLAILAGFGVLVLGEALRWNHLAAMACSAAAAAFIFLPGN